MHHVTALLFMENIHRCTQQGSIGGLRSVAEPWLSEEIVTTTGLGYTITVTTSPSGTCHAESVFTFGAT